MSNQLDKKLEEVLADNLEAYPSGYINYNDCVKAIKQAFVDEGWLRTIDLTIPAETPYIPRDPLMTGQEWYDKFSVEYLTSLGIGAGTLVDSNAIDAAKKASGIN